MAAGTVTPTEAGQGPGVLNIAANIGAKIRDAAQEAKEEREKAQEKGMEPKKGSLFKSALGNKFNPIKSKKAKAGWAKQFDWNKKSPDTAQQVKTPSETGGEKGKAKLKEFIAGGFTAIIKDTTAMRAKMDGIQTLSSANLEQATRTTGSLTMIKESVDAQTEIRRKALEQAKFAKSERRLERTKDVAGLTGTKGPGGSKEEQPGQQPPDQGGGWMDWLTNALGIGDLLSNFMPKQTPKWLQRLNPFKKNPTTRGGTPITSSATRPTGGGARVTGGTKPPNFLSRLNPKNFNFGRIKNIKPGNLKGGALSLAMLGLDLFMPEIQDAVGAGAEGMGFGIRTWSDEKLEYEYLTHEHTAAKLKDSLLGDTYSGGPADNRPALQREFERRGLALPKYNGSTPIPPEDRAATEKDLEQFGGVPEGYKLDTNGKLVKLNRGGVVSGLVNDPTKTTLNPGDKVIPLNRSAGKDMMSEGSGDLPMKAQAATILGVSTAFLSSGMGGTATNSVIQDIRKASKGVDIANLSFTSSLGGGQFKPINADQAAENFMSNLFKNVSLLGIKFEGGGSGGGGGNNTTVPGADIANTAVADAGSIASFDSASSPVQFTSGFGRRTPPTAGASSMHRGQDIGTGGEKGYYVTLKKSGTIVNNKTLDGAAGNWVGIDVGGGVEYRFMHLAQPSPLKVGDPYRGETIGEIGNTGVGTGEHLHFEKLVNGTHVDPKEDARSLLKIGNQLNSNFSPAAQVVTAPTGSDPGTTEQPSVTQEASDGMWGPSWLPWNWGKVADQGRKGATLGGNAFGYEAKYRHVTDPNQRRMLGLPPLQQSKGGSTPINKVRVTTTGRNKHKKYQKWDGNQWMTATGDSVAKYKSLYAAQQSAASPLGPSPVPPKNPPQQTIPPRQPATEAAAAVVMPPTQNINKKTADAAGSFGSSIPSAKVAAGNFADFLYNDLV